jgi:hypothetical protein
MNKPRFPLNRFCSLIIICKYLLSTKSLLQFMPNLYPSRLPQKYHPSPPSVFWKERKRRQEERKRKRKTVP